MAAKPVGGQGGQSRWGELLHQTAAIADAAGCAAVENTVRATRGANQP